MAGEAGASGWSKLLDPKWLKQALTFIGVTGAGGGGFAALCFGIGFLASRHHDEMLGLPSRAGAYTAMVRTGAMFFPNSLYYVLVGTWKAIAVLFALALAAWLLPDDVLQALRRHARPAPATHRVSAGAASFLLAHAALLALGLMLFEDRAATLHPSNRDLLLARSTDQQPPEAAATAAAFGTGASFRYFVSDRLPTKAARVREELRSDSETVRRHYGLGVALLAVFVALLVFERVYWGEGTLWLHRWLLRPVLYFLAAVLVVTLPAAYGVLWMPNGATYVEIATAATEPPVTGYLLTDISGDEPDIWTLALDDTTFSMRMRVFKRESISEIRVFADAPTDNLLKIAYDPSAAAAPRVESKGEASAGPSAAR